jgi:(p)ppGpp synthase/HD superfamily hydrolase
MDKEEKRQLVIAGHKKIQLYIYSLQSAELAHEGQIDKSGVPYIFHPIAVSQSFEIGSKRSTVALLHDTVEDTDMDLAVIQHYFGKDIAGAVDAITHRKGESYMDYLARVKANPIALDVKFADIAHNTSEERLSKLDQKTQDRLRKKYKKALDFLRE